VPSAEAPAWLVSLARGRNANGGGVATASAARWIQTVALPCSEGRRNDTLARLTGHLLRCRVNPYVVLELARLWNHGRCQPPLEDAEVVRTVNSICHREAQRREAARG
jgi:hypothetical protein